MLVNVKNIYKSFHSNGFMGLFKDKSPVSVIENLSFNVEENDFIKVSGRNGAGKTTLFKMLVDLIKPDQGVIERSGKISYISSNERSFYWRLTVEENLAFFNCIAKNFDKGSQNEVIECLNIADLLKKPFMTLSSGEKKKVIIARSLMNNPDLLLMDEITDSLDKASKINIIEFIYQKIHKEKEISILWSTHHINEIEDISNKTLDLDLQQFFRGDS